MLPPKPLSFTARKTKEVRASLSGVGCDPGGEDIWCRSRRDVPLSAGCGRRQILQPSCFSQEKQKCFAKGCSVKGEEVRQPRVCKKGSRGIAKRQPGLAKRGREFAKRGRTFAKRGPGFAKRAPRWAKRHPPVEEKAPQVCKTGL